MNQANCADEIFFDIKINREELQIFTNNLVVILTKIEVSNTDNFIYRIGICFTTKNNPFFSRQRFDKSTQLNTAIINYITVIALIR